MATNGQTEQRIQTLQPGQTVTTDEDRHSCPQCGAFVGPRKTYCSDSCRQAAYRQRNGADVHQRECGREVSAGVVDTSDLSNDWPTCSCPGCDNPTARGKRARFLMYCSAACKQKAKRIRRNEWKRQRG